MASEDGDEGNNDEEYESQEGKSGMIFLIDSRSTMFTKDELINKDDESHQATRINIALQCCRSTLLNKIIAKQKDLVGVVLLGTSKSEPETNTKHVSLLLELNCPGAPAIKKLDTFLEDANSQEIQRTYGSSDDFLLADALWYCSLLFSRSRQNLAEKRILLFTDDSDPHENNPDRAHMARKRAKDLNKVQISLEIISFGEFDRTKFYKELYEIVNGETDSEEITSSSRLEELLERVNRLDFKRRRYAKLKWNLGNDVSLGVSLYTLYREATVMPTETLCRATNESVKRVKQTYDQTTGELLLPSDVVEFLQIAGKDIEFTPEEKESLKKVMLPGITLLGFKPSSAVKEGMHCDQPKFIYPEETLIKGSKELMKALVERCIAKDKVAVCCLNPRNRAVTKYVYLVPSQETLAPNGRQLTPCGFHVIPIPFDNETREQTFEPSSNVDTHTLELAKRIINKLKMSYEPSKFENPKLQKFWKHLEALALEYEAPEVVEDQTVPDLDAQSDRLGNLSSSFNDVCSLEGNPTFVTKRESSSKQYTGATKKPKRNEDIDVVRDIKTAIEKKKVDTFTAAQLKEYLTFYNQKVTGMKKADLVTAVYNLKR